MKLVFKITLDDFKTFQNEFRSTMRGFLQIRLLQSIGAPSLFLLFIWFSTEYRWGWLPTLISSIPAAALGFYLWRESPGLWVRSNLEVMYSEGRLSGHLGTHSLEISEEGIIEKNEAGEHFSRWNQIENIHSTDNYTFIVTKLQIGYIVPRDQIIEGDYNAFLAVTWRKWLEHKP